MEEHGGSAGFILAINTKADLALSGGCVPLTKRQKEESHKHSSRETLT